MSADENVISLSGEPILPRGRNEEVVKELQRALEMAESGEIEGIFVAYAHADDTTSGARRGRSGRSLLGLVECMKLKLAEEVY